MNDREPARREERYPPAGQFSLSVGKHVVKRWRGKIKERKMCRENSRFQDNRQFSKGIIRRFDVHLLVRWHKQRGTCVYLYHFENHRENVIKIYLNRRIDPQKRDTPCV